jgi:hypothetical protein
MIRNNFMQDTDENKKKKYHLVNWQTICMPKDQGGLRILDLEFMNILLLAKCLWKLFNKTGRWQQILENNYLQHQKLCQAIVRKEDSHFFLARPHGDKTSFWRCCRVHVSDGRKISFWEDNWLPGSSLASRFLRL